MEKQESPQAGAKKQTVTADPNPALQRQCACGGSAGPSGECAGCRQQRLGIQPKLAVNQLDAHSAQTVNDTLHAVLRSPGQPLDTATRHFMETGFGHDFSQVQVHTGMAAASAARAVNALAYTVGRHVVFDADQYAPGTAGGRRLLAHELAHVVQQRNAAPTPQFQLRINDSDDRFEQEADAAATLISAQTTFHSRLAGSGTDQTEEELPFSQAIASPLPALSSTGSVRLQRTARFVPGPVHSVWNIADHIATGDMTLGFTPPVLNGRQIMSAAQARQAIQRPTIERNLPNIQAPSATTAVDTLAQLASPDPIHAPLIAEYRRRSGLPPGGVSETGEHRGPSDAEIKYRIFEETDCRITALPTNEGSFTMTLPSAGPWQVATSKANVAARMTQLGLTPPATCTTGDTTFSINGSPSDGDLVANTRTHEEHHAADHERVFNAVMLPWDAALTRVFNAGTTFQEANPTSCEAALYRAVGRTPDQVANSLWSGWIGANNAFHASAAGATATASNPMANADCTTSSIDVFHP